MWVGTLSIGIGLEEHERGEIGRICVVFVLLWFGLGLMMRVLSMGYVSGIGISIFNGGRLNIILATLRHAKQQYSQTVTKYAQ